MKLKCFYWPVHGETRIIRKFAWFPTHITTAGICVWLERYNVKKKYYDYDYDSGWETVESWLINENK